MRNCMRCMYIFVCMHVESVWLIKEVWSVSMRNSLGFSRWDSQGRALVVGT